MKFRINSGELKHTIEIYRKSIGVKDDDGIMRYPLNKLFSTKSKIVGLKGSEVIQALGNNVRVVGKFYIRYNRNIEVLEEDIIEYKNKKYNIKYVNNIEEANKYLEILVEVVM